MSDARTQLAYVGTATEADEDGIFTVRVDRETGAMETVDAVPGGTSPYFFAIDAAEANLYAVNKSDGGLVRSFDIGSDAALTERNAAASGGEGPCHCSLDAAEAYCFVANYAGGTVSMLPIRDDGGLDEPSCTIEHEGSGPNADRQSEAHPHSIRAGPDDRYAYAPDLGADRIVIYEIDRSADRLVPADCGPAELHPGAGPRHLAFHPDDEHVYCINELDSTLTTFVRDADTGTLVEQSTVDTLPPGTTVDSYTAEVVVHPNGDVVYGSNRGHDSISVFDATDPDTPELVECTSTGGEWPRNFVLDPAGEYLFAENKDTDDVQSFRIDPADGTLEPTGHELSVPAPCCMRFLESH